MIVFITGYICYLPLSLYNLQKTSKELLPVEGQEEMTICENLFCLYTTSGSSRREFLKERQVVGIGYSPVVKRREMVGKTESQSRIIKQLSLIFCLLGGILLSTSRHYKTKPTHGIGRYKHLLQPQEVKGAGVLQKRRVCSSCKHPKIRSAQVDQYWSQKEYGGHPLVLPRY